MLDRLQRFVGSLGSLQGAQAQREAMVDLLLWSMYADRRIALPENDHLDQLPESLPWDAVTPFSVYVGAALARVRDVLSDPVLADRFLDDIYERLGTGDMRRRAHEASVHLAQVDGQVAEEEALFLDRIRTRFGL